MKQLFIITCLFFTSLALSGQTCGAMTHKGTPCKNKVAQDGLKCWMHGGERKEIKDKGIPQQCSALTHKGVQCKNRTTNVNGKCFMHQN